MHQVLVSSILMQSKLIVSVLTKVKSRVRSGCAVQGGKSFCGHSALCVTEADSLVCYRGSQEGPSW